MFYINNKQKPNKRKLQQSFKSKVENKADKIAKNKILIERSQILFFCIFFLFFSSCKLFVQAGNLSEQKDTVVVVIDPGHGGENEGTIENGFQEKSMTLVTAMAMYEELSCFEGITVYMTRTEDKELSLKERAAYAASVQADFLFSIHYNASLNHNLFGSEVWISSQDTFNAYGYDFGCIWLKTMEEKGLFLRGVKTRVNEKGLDYYGIIREAANLSIPAVILEHCHVDEERDSVFCDSIEKQIAFGKADAHAVAEYFGLKSSSLGIDYSNTADKTIFSSQTKGIIPDTLEDETPPDICMITLKETKDKEVQSEEDLSEKVQKVQLIVQAADYDSMLLYYDYSIDGGITYSSLFPWPKSNARTKEYADTFTLTIDIMPDSTSDTHILLRAYNLFDKFTESNMVSIDGLKKTKVQSKIQNNSSAFCSKEKETENIEKNIIERTVEREEAEIYSSQPPSTLLTFLELCMICVVSLFLTIFLLQFVRIQKKRKLRPHLYCKKEDGNKKNQPK